MAKFIVSACTSSACETIEIEAETKEEAIDKYADLYNEGVIDEIDVEFEHFTVTDEDGKDEIINY